MAIADPKAFSETDPIFLRATANCFLCGERLTGSPLIYWNGNDEKAQQIWLHVNCTKRLADGLNYDFHKAGP